MKTATSKAITHCLQAPVRLYRALLSPLLGPRCRFYPTCSAYALEALERHGPGKGLLLTMTRLLRCHPWHKGGQDPVPEGFTAASLFGYKRGNPKKNIKNPETETRS